MVTTDVGKYFTFEVNISRLHDGAAMIVIARQDGETRSYQFPEKKIRFFAAIDGPVNDAVKFLLGET